MKAQTLAVAASMLMASSSLMAQAAAAPAAAAARPAGWHVRFDRAGTADSSMKLDQMGPGWHVTTNGRGSGIAWKDGVNATGNFRAEAETVLFPAAGDHLEGFGMIVGGHDLDGANQTYYYFLLRKDGQFTIKHRAGTAVHEVLAWTPSDAIVKQAGQEQAHNVLAVEATADSVRFLVNNQRVHAMARAGADVTGAVGLRVNHGLSVHVARLAVAQH